ncbi:MAG: hypothetical protein EA391_05495 [Balneolaceae bacterium]|nr:MAG: hypothetical protein EA391_05495 [Balneolaceae bacterium]
MKKRNGLESIGGNRVFSVMLWQHFIPAGSLIKADDRDGPLKWCRIDEKPAGKRFTTLIFWSFWIKPKGHNMHDCAY